MFQACRVTWPGQDSSQSCGEALGRSGKLWRSSGEALWKLGNTPKVLPITIGAQIAIVIKENATFKKVIICSV